jgi:glycosyltransferase involved in cell wall biosynthesis
MNILVGIPSYNEGNTIKNVVEVIDASFKELNIPVEIFLIDSASEDDTVEIFQSILTINKKHLILSSSLERGKGKNVFLFFDYFIKKNADFAMLFDADLTSIEPIWIKKYLEKLTQGYDLVLPEYKRKKFEGSATNHLVFPILYALGDYIRQPLAGDFGISKNLVKELLAHKHHSDANKYGIDIFITYIALYKGLKFASVKLDQKIHKPSFPNLPLIFEQVLNSLQFLLRKYPFRHVGEVALAAENNSTLNAEYVQKKAANELRDKALDALKINLLEYKENDLRLLIERAIESGNLKQNDWCEVLLFILKLKELDSLTSSILTNLYIVRIVSFWEEIEDRSPEEVEQLLQLQAEQLKSNL